MTPYPSPGGGGRSTGSPMRPARPRAAEPADAGSAAAMPRTPGQLDAAAGPLTELADTELLAAHVNGNPLAFSVLVTRHRDRMWAVALRTMRNPEEAADALQEAYISAFRRAASFRGDAQVTTWLHRVVVNSCLDRIRRNKVRAAEPLPEDPDRAEELATTVDTTDQVLEGEQRADIVTALGTLNADQRAALVLVDMEGYSVEEAAGMLGCATGTVKSRCARGRAKLVPLLRHLREPDAPVVRPNRDARTAAGRRTGTSRPTRQGRESR
ncbi:RNA polymerase sigma factor SigM [Microlunatus soli]|uniref:RNA polymerase, sigma subunit, ECF family n=2 Tax=Microlunatus soli TaxID=630515 RepID=A0A1H1UM97_9ACTN|nr:RNA polymerase sigma factor SigM [Microlunatus soli]SDS73450.1 RNA polymerase, sigma subunit, ECF family [Microlunatus soli]